MTSHVVSQVLGSVVSHVTPVGMTKLTVDPSDGVVIAQIHPSAQPLPVGLGLASQSGSAK
jgi:hypothetical protein